MNSKILTIISRRSANTAGMGICQHGGDGRGPLWDVGGPDQVRTRDSIGEVCKWGVLPRGGLSLQQGTVGLDRNRRRGKIAFIAILSWSSCPRRTDARRGEHEARRIARHSEGRLGG